MADHESRAGEELARAWLRGKSELVDDLAALVGGMPRELGPSEIAFLKVIGEAARSAARGEVGQAPIGATGPARIEAQTAAAAPAPPELDVDASWRRARERVQQARRDELWRAIS